MMINCLAFLSVALNLALAYVLVSRTPVGTEHRFHGIALLPVIDLFQGDPAKRTLVVESQGVSRRFAIPAPEVERLLKSESTGPDSAPAEVTVLFRKNLFGRPVEALVVDVQPGTIRKPK